MTDSERVLNRIRDVATAGLKALFVAAFLPAAGLGCGLLGGLQGSDIDAGPVDADALVAPPPPTELAAPLVFWSREPGELVRLLPGASEPTPLVLPYDPAGAGIPDEAGDRQCRKCHAFGGDRIAFTFFGIGGPAGVATAQTGEPFLDNADDLRWSFPALTGDGALLIATERMRLHLFDAQTGERLRDDLVGRASTQAAVASRADTFVFVGDPTFEGEPATDPTEFDRADLWVARLDPDGADAYDVRRVVSADGQAIAYPAISPDGRFAVYTRAPWSQSARGEELTPGAFELVDLSSGEIASLAAAAPEGLAWMPSLVDDDDDLALAFVSRSAQEPLIRLARVRPSQWLAPCSASIPLPAAESLVGFFPRFAP